MARPYRKVIDKAVFSPRIYSTNLYSEYIMRQANLEKIDIGVRIGGRKINNLRYVDDPPYIYLQKVKKNC